MMSDFKKLQAEWDAEILADKTISKARGEIRRRRIERAAYLVSSFSSRIDLPAGALRNLMSPEVAGTLSSMGFNEPVSMSQFPNKWWVANVDIASVHPDFESGGGTVRVEASTEEIAWHYSYNYCEIIGGPFNSQGEITGK